MELRGSRRLIVAVCLLGGALSGAAQKAALQQASEAFRAGSAAYAQSDLKEARRQFSAAVRLAPGIEEGHSALGVVLCALGEYPQAIAELRTALKLKPGDRNAEENLAQAYSETGAREQAIELFRKMDQESPLSGALLAMWARDLAAAANPGEAIAVMQRAVEADPKNAVEIGRAHV